MPAERREWLFVLLGSAALVTIVIHAVFVPRYFPEDVFRTSLYLVAGWTSYTLAFYAIGRLVSDPGELPSMRTADVGTVLFLVSLLLALFLDSLGFTPQTVPVAYVLPGIGAYAGLALVGWSIGQRSKAINRIARSRQ